MRILFVTSNFFWPQVVGGVETSTVDLGEALQSTGHSLSVICALASGDTVWLKNRLKRRLSGAQFPRDNCCGLQVYRGWNVAQGLPGVVDEIDPDVLLLSGIAKDPSAIGAAALQTGRPVLYYVHDLGLVRSMSQSSSFKPTGWISNSPYTQRVLSRDMGISSSMVPPVIRRERYLVSTPGKAVTMINPLVGKGGDVAVELASRFPEVPFIFVAGWYKVDKHTRRVRQQTAHMKNVRWMRSRQNMRAVYAMTRILLAPSRYEETWGRTVTEAQFSGIPSIVSDSGALPDTAGPGGIVVPTGADADDWAAALRRLLDDSEYARLSEAALRHAQRPEIRPDTVARQFIQVLSEARV